MSYCTKCGLKLGAGDCFCVQCGTAAEIATETPAPATAPAKSSVPWWLPPLAALMVGGAVALGAVTISHRHERPEEAAIHAEAEAELARLAGRDSPGGDTGPSASGLIGVLSSAIHHLLVSVELHARIEHIGSDLIMVTNADPYAWMNIDIWINTDFHLNVPRIESGVVTLLDTPSFADSRGKRFDPQTIKLIDCYVRADTPEGRGSGLWAWK